VAFEADERLHSKLIAGRSTNMQEEPDMQEEQEERNERRMRRLRWISQGIIRFTAIGYLIGLVTPTKIWEYFASKLYAYRGRLYLVRDVAPQRRYGAPHEAHVSQVPVWWLWYFTQLHDAGLPDAVIPAAETDRYVTQEEIKEGLRRLHSSRTRRSA
jgi:hypothetical protein